MLTRALPIASCVHARSIPVFAAMRWLIPRLLQVEREQPELRGKSRVVIAAGLFEVLDEGVGEPGDIGGR